MLIYTHIPKTAGSAVMLSFVRMFGKSHVFHAGKPAETERLRNMMPEELKRLRVVGAHYPQPLLAKICGVGTHCTTLREPVERVVSLYAHAAREPAHPHHASAQRDLDSWLDWLEEDPRRLQVSTQTHYLSNSMKTQGALLALEDMVVGDSSDIPGFIASVAKAVNKPVPPTFNDNVAPTKPEIGGAQHRHIEKVFRVDIELYEKFRRPKWIRRLLG